MPNTHSDKRTAEWRQRPLANLAGRSPPSGKMAVLKMAITLVIVTFLVRWGASLLAPA